METLAEAVTTLGRAPSIHVAVDGLTEPTTRTLADDLAWAFFAPRAAHWGQRFRDDGPACAAAVAEVGLHPGRWPWT